MGYLFHLTIWILITKHSWMHCQIFSEGNSPTNGGEGLTKWDFHRKSRKTSPPPKLTQGTGLSTARGVSNGNGNFTSRKTAPHRQLSVGKNGKQSGTVAGAWKSKQTTGGEPERHSKPGGGDQAREGKRREG
jgi:hypothetical protein